MFSIDKHSVDDAIRLSRLPHHRLHAAIGAYLEHPEIREHIVGLTLSCSDDAELVAKYGCSEDPHGARVDLAERGHAALKAFKELYFDKVQDLVCEAFQAQQSGDLEKRTFAAIVSASTSSVLEAESIELPSLVVSALLMSEPLLRGVCAGHFEDEQEQIVPDHDWS